MTRAVEADVTTKTRLLAWAREIPEWWNPVDAAAALGVSEDDVREALDELEGEGLIYRAVALADSYRLTADGRNVEAQMREEEVASKGHQA